MLTHSLLVNVAYIYSTNYNLLKLFYMCTNSGIQSTTFMMVLATNRPEDLDSAVLDRIDISMYIGLPQPPQREAMIKLYKDIHIHQYFENMLAIHWYHYLFLQYYSMRKARQQLNDEITQCFTQDTIHNISLKLEGFSGREISKLFIGINHAMLLSRGMSIHSGSSNFVSYDMVMEVVQQKINDHQQILM